MSRAAFALRPSLPLSLSLPLLRPAAAVVAAALLCGCQGEPPSKPAGDTGTPASEARATDRREPLAPVAGIEKPSTPSPEAADEAAPSDPSVTPPPAPPAGQPGSAGSPSQQAVARASTEYHEKMRALRERYAGKRDDPAYAQEVLALRRWFSSEMRAIRMADRSRRENAGATGEPE